MKPMPPSANDENLVIQSLSASALHPSAPASISGSETTRVLLIDDDEEEWIIARDLLRDVENGSHFQLDWVSSYEAGLDALGRGEHDVYLVDYRLGVRSGLELLGEAVALGINAPLILMTGQGDPIVDAAATQAGAADYLVKDSLNSAQLERAIRYALAQKRTEDKLREAAAQNALLSAAVANTNVGVVITGTQEQDFSITFVNAAFEQITGYSAAEVLGRNPRFLQNGQGEAEVLTQIRSALENFTSFEGNISNYRKDGTPFCNEMRISPVRDAAGRPLAFLGLISDVTAKIEAESALRQSRENLAAAQRLTHLGSWVLELENLDDLGHNTLLWSDEVYRILGLEPHDHPARRLSFLQRVHEADREIVTAALGKAVRGEEPYDLECRVVRPNGEERHVRIHAEIERDSEGKPLRALGTLHDITESKHAQSQALENRRRLDMVAENAPLLLWSLDANGVFEFIEGRALEIMGLRAENYLHQSIFELTFENPHSVEMARLALSGQDADEVLEYHGLYFDTKYSTMRGENGEIIGAVGVAIDVTARREAESAFRQSQTHLQAVMDAAPIVIWATNAQGIFTVSQGKALERTGLKQGEAIGQSIFDMYGEDSAIADMARRALGGEEAQSIIEMDGHIFDVRYAPTRREDGTVSGVVGVSYDITDRVRAQRELDESEERFARIVTNVPGMVYRFHRALSGKMTFLYVSDGCRDVYGIEAEVVLRDAHVLMEIIHPDDLSGFFESVFESERTLEPWYWEGRVVNSHGHITWIRGQARPARELDGATVWDGLVVDISESRKSQEEILRSRAALNEAQKLAHIGSFEWNLITGDVTWSQEMFRLFGYEPNAFQPNYGSILEFLAPEMRDSRQKDTQESVSNGSGASMAVQIVRRDGVRRMVQTHSRVEVDDLGRVARLVGSAQDVTEIVDSQRALRESEQRYALAAQGANDGLWDWNLVDGRIFLSPRWKMMLGYDIDQIGDSPEEWFSRVHEDDIERMRATLSLHLSGESPHFECEFRLRCADGSYRWMLGRGLAVTDEEGKAHRIAGSQTDITQHKTAEAQLSHNAFYDTLTELPNRALFLDRLEKTLGRARRNPDYTFAVLFLDIDRFKKINDSLGHLPGDQLLIEAAKRFETCLRPGDTVARLGGDEFAILIDDIRDEDDVSRVAARIQKELERPFELEGRDVFVTVSIGVAPCKGGEERPDELLRNADTAMYRAKSQGRARHEIFDATMHQRAVKLLELETDLWRAVERNEMRLHYQPIIALESGQICGYEALVRWQHPQRGLVSPGDFIPLAEETGLIVPIGWWVLAEACRQAKEWSDRYDRAEPHFISVNLSSKQFSQGDMIEVVSRIVRESGFDPNYLKLEITESVIMENTESANSMLLELKELGIRLSMDDFGTGYSSLSYLHRFPLDTLKIDRSFVSQMRAHSKNGEIVETILNLADGLSMNVVAEGVETEEQLYSLRKMGCGFAQGFFFSRPLPPERVEALIAEEPQW